jgi:redox-sensitive bicupin YhaK (pirin superfamily)
MITLRRANERGRANHGWLNSHFSFSFADYYDPAHMGFRSLRVINDDRVAPGKGFGTHPHRDMEIITYVLEGALEHRDSLGTGSVIRPGDVQRMSAGTGILHSEFNPSPDEPVHFLQIWILPEQAGIKPSYEQKNVPVEERRGKLRLIAAPDASADKDAGNGAVRIHQDARIYSTVLEAGEEVTHDMQPERHAWIQVASGSVMLNGQLLETGDGAAVSDEDRLTIEGKEMAELLLFDLA